MTTNPPLSASGPPTLSKRQIAFAALHHLDYRRYFIVNLLSAMGDNIEHVISYWLLFQKFRSPVLGGLRRHQSLDARFFSLQFISGPSPTGTIAEESFKPAQFMYAGVSLTWGILFLTDTIQVWHACVLCSSMAWRVLGGPGGQLIIHDIVGREYLQSAVRLNSTARQFGILLGPAVGGATMLFFGPPIGLFINVLMFSPMIILMFILPYTGHGRDEG